MKRFLSLLLWVPLLASAAGSDYVDRSGTVTLGGTSQTLAAASGNRGPIIITNPSTESEVLCVNITSAASCTTPGSFLIQSGGSLTLNTDELVTVVAATTGHKFTAKERAIGASLIGGGSGGGGGGGGAITAAASSYAAGAGVDGWDLTQGAKADAVCATDTGTCSLLAVQKRVATNLTTLKIGRAHV